MDELFKTYAIERQEQQTQGAIQLAIVGAGLIYAVAVASKLASVCADKSCGPRPPVALLLATPVPLFALFGYLILSASSSLQRAKYLVALEEELEKQIADQPQRLCLPTGFRRSEVVWDPDLRRAPLGLRLINAMSYVAILALEISLATWAIVLAGHRTTSLVLHIVIAVYAIWLAGQLWAMRVGWGRKLIELADAVGR